MRLSPINSYMIIRNYRTQNSASQTKLKAPVFREFCCHSSQSAASTQKNGPMRARGHRKESNQYDEIHLVSWTRLYFPPYTHTDWFHSTWTISGVMVKTFWTLTNYNYYCEETFFTQSIQRLLHSRELPDAHTTTQPQEKTKRKTLLFCHLLKSNRSNNNNIPFLTEDRKRCTSSPRMLLPSTHQPSLRPAGPLRSSAVSRSGALGPKPREQS